MLTSCFPNGKMHANAHRIRIPGELAAEDIPDALLILSRSTAVVDDDICEHLQPGTLQALHTPAAAIITVGVRWTVC